MNLFRKFEARRRFDEANASYEKNCRRPFSFGVPNSWYKRKVRYMIRLNNILMGIQPFGVKK